QVLEHQAREEGHDEHDRDHRGREAGETVAVQTFAAGPADGAAALDDGVGAVRAYEVLATHVDPKSSRTIVLFPLWTFHASLPPRLCSSQSERRSMVKNRRPRSAIGGSGHMPPSRPP